jgi:hypothetical protein
MKTARFLLEAGRFFGFAGKGSVFLMPPSRASLAPTGFVFAAAL